MRLKRYFKIWWIVNRMSLQTIVSTKIAGLFYLAGKFFRFFAFLWFLLHIQQRLTQISGFTTNQLILVFLIFNIFDLLGQIFFRGIYWFLGAVINGDLDKYLLKPVNDLFQLLMIRMDFLDLPLLIMTILMLPFYLPKLTWQRLGSFVIISIISFSLIAIFHILVMIVSIWTLDDSLLWIYRDMSGVSRIPASIYPQWFKNILTWVLPIIPIMFYPALTLIEPFNYLTIILIIVCTFVAGILVINLWRFSLRRYTSASN